MCITNSEAYEILASCFHLNDVYVTDTSQRQVYIMNLADVKC